MHTTYIPHTPTKGGLGGRRPPCCLILVYIPSILYAIWTFRWLILLFDFWFDYLFDYLVTFSIILTYDLILDLELGLRNSQWNNWLHRKQPRNLGCNHGETFAPLSQMRMYRSHFARPPILVESAPWLSRTAIAPPVARSSRAIAPLVAQSNHWILGKRLR